MAVDIIVVLITLKVFSLNIANVINGNCTTCRRKQFKISDAIKKQKE